MAEILVVRRSGARRRAVLHVTVSIMNEIVATTVLLCPGGRNWRLAGQCRGGILLQITVLVLIAFRSEIKLLQMMLLLLLNQLLRLRVMVAAHSNS